MFGTQLPDNTTNVKNMHPHRDRHDGLFTPQFVIRNHISWILNSFF